MKNFIYLFLFSSLLSFSNLGLSQDEPLDKDLRLEFEPGLYFSGGRSLLGMYNITKKDNLALGFYLMTTNVPEQIGKHLLTNVNFDSTAVSITQEYALNLRYRIKFFKNYESNPFVGVILGWENIRLKKAGLPDLNINTFVCTPHLGFEFYVYKKMVYLNPQIRSVFYFGSKKSDLTRPENLNSFILLPSISVGLRL